MMYRSIPLLLFFLLLIACDNKESSDDLIGNEQNGSVANEETKDTDFISGADISAYPKIAKTNPVFYDAQGNPGDFLEILRANGVNTARLKLWVDPKDEHAGFEEVRDFSQSLKSKGFKIMLTIHYSDTWADPGQQATPQKWQGLELAALKDSVYNYTQRVVEAMAPEYVQIGNEINSGFLHPSGKIDDHRDDFISLLESGIAGVRESSKDSKIILHFAGIKGADWFFDLVKSLDYDIMGLSYYPKWHGKSIDSLKARMDYLVHTHGKQVLIAETAYPFTLGWNDMTNNIVGTEEQLILPDYPPTPEGQQKFIRMMRTLSEEVENGLGFCYWGAELVAWKGAESTEGSPWENQALFDFDNKALPVLREFKMD